MPRSTSSSPSPSEGRCSDFGDTPPGGKRKRSGAGARNFASSAYDDREREDLEDESEDEVAEADDLDDWLSPRRGRRAGRDGSRRRARRRGGAPPRFARTDMEWETVNEHVSEAGLDSFIKQYGEQHAAGKGYTRAGQFKNGKQVYKCCYKDCPARLRAVARTGGGWRVEVAAAASKQHDDHREAGRISRGVPGEYMAALGSPGLWAEAAPKQMRARLRSKLVETGIAGSRAQASELVQGVAKKLTSKQKAVRRKVKRDMLDGASESSYGGVSSLLEKMGLDYQMARDGFDEHSCFVLGAPLVVPEAGRVTIAFSTKNLLLNAYRQSVFGLPQYLAVDTSHRYVREGHCVMVVGTMSVTQHFHPIAFALCSHEDTAAHVHVLKQVRQAVHAVVRECEDTGELV